MRVRLKVSRMLTMQIRWSQLFSQCRSILLWEHHNMTDPQFDGFHKVTGVRITHGVPKSAGWIKTIEKVQIHIPARALGEKDSVDFLVDPGSYAETARIPGYFWSSGKATFWIYKATVFVDFNRRKRPEIKTLADQLLAPRKSQSKPRHAARVPKRRETIPKQVKIDVWQRDSGRCVECGSNSNLEFDHIIPLNLGGANTFRNLQLLCGPCNRSKGASL